MPCPSLPTHAPLTEAFCDLSGDLMRLARRLARSEAEAQDLVQEVLLRLWRRRAEVAEVDDLRAYARTSLRNLYRQGLRRLPMEALEDCASPAVDPAVFGALALRDVAGAIERLPADQARLIRLVASGETSPAVLSALTGVPKGTVMSRLARARAALRGDMGIAPDAPVSSLI
ncbi:RNA polymerase sigma factor [Roseovarius sp. LXJ103]|uniref:RNA polymerase sigma factor n=1 Tax=Roseovarius carneus TaxID=2853164 RepID=UPI000D61AA00|nr:RNA polymerase sigma factor [Roseovarius carneus]MBZ8119517.1 RNA polymerase sigma factor [Roseovarius carneus]PWE34856.1 RNA polymerase subunit sigma-24 [Pelagicola sp. LXJ1103]